MSLVSKIIGFQLKRRISKLNNACADPLNSQNTLLINLLKSAKNTLYGKKYKFKLEEIQ